MVRIISATATEAETNHYACRCTHCGAELAFTDDDVWIEDPHNNIGRISCPVCRKKIFLKSEALEVEYATPFKISEEEYNNAQQDASKAGIQELIEDRQREIQQGGK